MNFCTWGNKSQTILKERVGRTAFSSLVLLELALVLPPAPMH